MFQFKSSNIFVSNRSSSLFLSSCSEQGLDRFSILSEHKDRVQMKCLQRLSTLTAHFRFSRDPAATCRNSDISLFHRNTKSVFQFKSSNIFVSNRSSPLFMSSCSEQGLDRFSISSEHKDRVRMKCLQRLSTLTAHFRFSFKKY